MKAPIVILCSEVEAQNIDAAIRIIQARLEQARTRKEAEAFVEFQKSVPMPGGAPDDIMVAAAIIIACEDYIEERWPSVS